MKFPQESAIDQSNTHRLIPYRYSDLGRPILDRLAEGDNSFLDDLTELEGATKERLIGEGGGLPGISAIELVSGFDLAHIVNASFTYAHPFGGRFNTSARGAWYASFEMETAQAEVAFHRGEELKEIAWEQEEVSPYVDYLADFRHRFHDIRRDSNFADCLSLSSYLASQALAVGLLKAGSAGIVYPTVRRETGDCICCFRPPLVQNVRQGKQITLIFRATKLADVVEAL